MNRKPHSEKTKQKIRNSLMGKKHTQERKKNISLSKIGKSHPHKGHIQTKATRDKISKARKGKPTHPWTKESREKMRLIKIGSKTTLETRRKQSKALRGNKNYNWKGGRTKLQEQIRKCFKNKQWISDVFERDNYTCQNCGRRCCRLEAHHIKYFSTILDEHNIKTIKDALKCKELWDIKNGKTLCLKCHNILPKKKFPVMTIGSTSKFQN
jgi:hypothetical protein